MKIGTGEILLILMVALLVLGPEKMPLYAKKVGKAFNTLKDYASKLTEDISENILEPLEEVQKPLKKVTDPLTNIANDITQPMEEMRNSFYDIGKPSKKEDMIQEKVEAESVPHSSQDAMTTV